LLYQLQWSAHEELLEALPEDWGRPEPPEFPAGAGWIWTAWQELDSERPIVPVGMGGGVPGRIPWRAADQWARRHGVAGFEFDFLIRALSAMDAILINHALKKAS
jgi:hypothetical protein